MRNSFAKKITELATINNKLTLLAGDIGNRLFDDFKRQSPDKFFNCGVAEQNMIGVSAGLAQRISSVRLHHRNFAPQDV